MNGHTKYQVVPTSLQKWIIIPKTYLISLAWRCRTGASLGNFHDDIIFKGATLPFQLFLKFSYIFKALFLQNHNTSVKIDHGNFKLDLSRKFFDLQAVLIVTGCIGCIVFKWLKIPTLIVLEVDALPK